MSTIDLRSVPIEIDGHKATLDLSRSHKFSTAIFEITSRCNLRCLFCFKSISGYNEQPGRDMDMPDTVFQHAVRFIRDVQPRVCAFVGVGEPTFRKDWQEIVLEVQKHCHITTINTNFGRLYGESELDTLLSIGVITISIESADAAKQKELRRSVDLRNIVYNLASLKKRARMKGVPAPRIQVNCTVTDKNVFDIRELASLCAELRVDCLTLSSLYELEGLNAVASIEGLAPDQLKRVEQELISAKEVLQNSSTAISFQPRLLQLTAGVKEKTALASGLTRLCLQPWGTYTIGADGKVYPCCVTEDSFAHIEEDSETLRNGEAIRTIRERLLRADLPAMCRQCSNAPLGKPAELMRQIALAAIASRQVSAELASKEDVAV